MGAAGPFVFRVGHGSHVGCRRKVNEDGLIARADLGLWAVADGMGGHSAGDVASALILGRLETTGIALGCDDLAARVLARLVDADEAIRDHARRHGLGMIGSTVAVLGVQGRDYACLWAGDSRVYRLHDGQILPLTRDHSEVVELLDAGVISAAQAETWPRRNVITRAIGVTGGESCAVIRGKVMDHDRFVLCTDGLTGHLDDTEIADLATALTPELAAEALIRRTLERGARDNVTVIVISVLPNPARDSDLSEDPFDRMDPAP